MSLPDFFQHSLLIIIAIIIFDPYLQQGRWKSIFKKDIYDSLGFFLRATTDARKVKQ